MTSSRVGLIVPSSNTTMETEVPEMLRRYSEATGERFTYHASRARLHNVDPESLDRMVEDSDRCALELSDAAVDVLAYACLVAIMARGPGAHVEAEDRLTRAAAENGRPAPVVSSAGALIRGLEALDVRRVALVTPYQPALAARVAAYIEAAGVVVTDMIALDVVDNLEVGRLDQQALIGHAKRLNLARTDAVVLSCCVQMPSLDVIPAAQEALGIPVLSAAAATVHGVLTALGREPIVPDAGALLDGTRRSAAAA
jgi:maleate isomerase